MSSERTPPAATPLPSRAPRKAPLPPKPRDPEGAARRRQPSFSAPRGAPSHAWLSDSVKRAALLHATALAGAGIGLELGGRWLALVSVEPCLAIGAHVVDQRHERLALVGERVLDARRHLGVRVAFDDAVLLEAAKTKRERSRADSGERPLELAEPLGATREVANDEKGPLAGDDLGGATDGTGGIHSLKGCARPALAC